MALNIAPMQFRQAKEIAVKLLRQLEPLCLQSHIAGSVRRESHTVKDIELVVVPRTTEVKNLFQEVVATERLGAFISTVRSFGVIGKGDPKTGRYVQILLPEDIKLDLFIPQETDWARQLAIRTGSSDYSHKVLANAWLRIGWCGTENGLRLQTESYQKVVGRDNTGKEKKQWFCDRVNPTLAPVWQDELALFRWLGLPWVQPNKRYV